MNKFILSLVMCMVLISLVGASQDSLGTYKQGEDVILLQICGTCTYNNITSIVLPNSTHLPLDVGMDKRGMEYTYEFNQTDLVGTYLVNGAGDLDGTNNAWAYDFEVTGTESIFGIPQVIFYIGVIAVLSFFFVLIIWWIGLLPTEHPMDWEGNLMSMNYLVYMKPPLMGLAWGFLVMISFLFWNLAEAYFATSLVAKMFEVVFKFLMYSIMIGLPVIFWYTIVKVIEAKKFQRMIDRGIFNG